jgi:hypothetical protein
VIAVATLTAFVLVRGVAMARRTVDEIPENGP